MVNLSILDYFKKVILNTLSVAFLSLIAPISVKCNLSDSPKDAFLIIALSVASVCAVSFIIGMNKEEKYFIKDALKKHCFKK